MKHLDDTHSSDKLLKCSQKLGQVIEALNSDAFLTVFFSKLSEVCPFELVALLVYRNRSVPLCLYDNFSSQQAQMGITNYIKYTYVLNPFYQAYLNGITPGVYRIKELAPDGYFTREQHNLTKISISNTEEIGYITEGWPKKLEEISIAILLDDGAAAEIILLRSGGGGFADSELAMLRGIQPIVAALLKSYWDEHQSQKAQSTDHRIDEAFENFGKPVLTGRECKVMQLILRGHSTLSISLELNVAVTTIKTHRKNAYMKLKISTQSELLSLFINSLRMMETREDI